MVNLGLWKKTVGKQEKIEKTNEAKVDRLELENAEGKKWIERRRKGVRKEIAGEFSETKFSKTSNNDVAEQTGRGGQERQREEVVESKITVSQTKRKGQCQIRMPK